MSCSVINTTKYKNLFFFRQCKTAYGQKNVVLIRGKDRLEDNEIPWSAVLLIFLFISAKTRALHIAIDGNLF